MPHVLRWLVPGLFIQAVAPGREGAQTHFAIGHPEKLIDLVLTQRPSGTAIRLVRLE